MVLCNRRRIYPGVKLFFSPLVARWFSRHRAKENNCTLIAGGFMEWGEFLRVMSGSGVNAAVGFLLSFLADYWPWYNGQESRLQRLVFIALSFAIPIAATIAAIATGEFGAINDWPGTWWPAIVAGAVAAFSGTLAHTRKLR
jgi:MFS family permease